MSDGAGPMSSCAGPREALLPILEESRSLGFLGPGPIEEHIDHATAFMAVVGDQPNDLIDLGSGGGIPGLVLAVKWPRTRVVLLDGSVRRTAFLQRAVVDLGIDDRVEVWKARAEDVGRDSNLRERAEVVVSRSFGAPPVVAECAAPLLRLGGRLVVSEPPKNQDRLPQRWPEEGLSIVGLRLETMVEGPPAFAVLRAIAPCPDRYPRRVGIPAKRPLF